jgi:hypothetical protein
MNSLHAPSSSANEEYSWRRLVLVETRSALACFAEASTMHLEAGFVGRQVRTRDSVVSGEIQGLLVPDGDLGNMGGYDGLSLSVRTYVGGAAKDLEVPAQGREYARRDPRLEMDDDAREL